MQIETKNAIILVAITADSEGIQTSESHFLFTGVDAEKDASAKAETLLMDDAFSNGGRVFSYALDITEYTHESTDHPVDAPEEE